jgi:hypothetical protein
MLMSCSAGFILRIPDQSDAGNKEDQSQYCVNGNELDIPGTTAAIHKIDGRKDQPDGAQQGEYDPQYPLFHMIVLWEQLQIICPASRK